MSDQNKFTYTYSAKRQEELDSIRKKYLPEEENKMALLRRLDKRAETPGLVVSLIVGIAGTLVMGLGMACVMEWADRYFVLGIVIGIVGMACMGISYPLYTRITKKNRARIAPQILKLTRELSGGTVSKENGEARAD